MDYFILTRFNIPLISQGILETANGLLGCDPDWLSHRFRLFKRWTLPSVQSQSCKQFRWLCFFSEDTPDEYLQEAKTWDIVEIISVPSSPLSTWIHPIAASAIADRVTSEWVASTRLDNDDMIAWDFVERVRQNLRETEEWLTFSTGAVSIAASMTHNMRYAVNNPFLTRVGTTLHIKATNMAAAARIPTALSINHAKVKQSLIPVREIIAPVLWCSVIHEYNVCNTPNHGDPARPLSLCDMQERFPHLQLSRIELINQLIKDRKFQSYLEIGVKKGATFNRVQAEKKTGVDSAAGSAATIKMTSDAFFELNKDTFDLVFIDGLHHWENVLRDVDNSLVRLNPGGVIILHDCMPIKHEHQLRPQVTGVWNGDVWKAFIILRARLNIDCAVLNCDQGLGVVLPRRNTQPIRDPLLTWDDYCNRRTELLRVVDVPGIWDFLGGEFDTPPVLLTSGQLRSYKPINKADTQ